MPGTECLSEGNTCTSALERIFQKLHYTPGQGTEEPKLLSHLSTSNRAYLEEFTAERKTDGSHCRNNGPISKQDQDTLRTYLCWSLETKEPRKALAVLLLLEGANSDVIEPPVFDDVMQHVVDTCPEHVVPPSLLIRWARILQVKGDLHGAIRHLNAAKKFISEGKTFSGSGNADMILGECTQMAGLTLNKMCCWKSAVEPLMESVSLFRRCGELHADWGNKAVDAAVVSMEMVAKCLCSITHGDYVDLKQQLLFQHHDRFYQAYTMCIEAAASASESELLFIRAQNQATEALLKYAAHCRQQEQEHALEPVTLLHQPVDPKPSEVLFHKTLEKAVQACLKSLKAHSGLPSLARREQFFEFIRSVFLISQALGLSPDSSQDRKFGQTLRENARVLYAEYCGQLSMKNFCPGVVVDLKQSSLDVRRAIEEIVNDFGLQNLEDGVASLPPAGQVESATGKESNGGKKIMTSDGDVESFTPSLEIASAHQISVTSLKPPMMSQMQYCDEVEVGLPVDPQANAIPLYDVPLSIFQSLCGCKVGEDQQSTDGRSMEDKSRMQTPWSTVEEEQCALEKSKSSSYAEKEEKDSLFSLSSRSTDTQRVLGSEPMVISDSRHSDKHLFDDKNHFMSMGCTQDSGYSSVPLVDTFLTTKFPTHTQHINFSSIQQGNEPYRCQDEVVDRHGWADRGGDRTQSSGIGSLLEEDGGTEALSAESGCRRRSALDKESGMATDEPGDLLVSSISLADDTVKRARLLKFNPVTGLWTGQTTLVYVGRPLDLDDKVKGNCREAFDVQFLHQDEVLGRYVGKRYRRQRAPSQYLQDVTCQKTARFLVTLFNYALHDLRYDIQIVYVPVAHLQLLSRDGSKVVDWLNVEPYLEGDFIKLTNNLKYCNSQGRTLATALTHFTHSVSEGRLMLVDLQGWLPREGRGVVYLTDPQFHTSSSSSSPLSSCDLGQQGIKAFWESVHPQCNAICQALKLDRPKCGNQD